MNKFVSALLATVAYTKHNLAQWYSATDFGFFNSGTTCGASWTDCVYWGQSYAEGDAVIAWELDNYWNDGSNETDAVFEAYLLTESYIEYDV